MKVIKVLAALTLVASMLAMPVFAAEVVPSIEYKDGVQLIDYTLDEINTPCRTVHIFPFFHIYNDDIIAEEILGLEDYENSEMLEENIRTSLRNALAELRENLLHHLVVGFDEAWERITEGAPLENAVVTDLFEIVLICSEAEKFMTDEQITVSFKVDGLEPDDRFLIVHKPTGSDKWIVEEYTVDENGVITMTIDKLSPFAIVKDNGAAPVATVTSPQTGVTEFAAAAAVLGMAALAAGGIAVGKKFRKTNAQ